MNEKLVLLGIVGVAGVAVYTLTRKSVAPVAPTGTATSALQLPTAVATPVAIPVPGPATPMVVVVSTAKKPLVTLPQLDAGLSQAELLAIQSALTNETISANLTGFASTFEPTFPIAAAVLRAQAVSLQGGQNGTMTGAIEKPCCDDCADSHKPPCTPIVTGKSVVKGLPFVPFVPTTFGVEIH